MREIKIRGYSVEKLCGDSQWVEGFGVDEVKLTNGETKYFLYTPYGIYQVYKESIGQYTGLKDNTINKDFPDGIEIYEKDILHDPVINESLDIEFSG
ncbi:hypothetical protein B4102_3774 [Heyndrickxia sporothermodurans]|uniref:Uncharacterized protein n=1 Tax=Heyndrickxia sporothermodurans TaxID=46224 RepID=A0A150KL72_9BACI|nr:hypothetical protein [Heyndrickxia sporothermodurans]KYC92233.1 hypothetical protein B4102_3774 [Heyndrickxia sporothermodurans]